jgi:hypothetical protein
MVKSQICRHTICAFVKPRGILGAFRESLMAELCTCRANIVKWSDLRIYRKNMEQFIFFAGNKASEKFKKHAATLSDA